MLEPKPLPPPPRRSHKAAVLASSMSVPNLAPPPPRPLSKQRSWSPDSQRDEAWSKLKHNQLRQRSRSKSVTDDDLTELKACFDLGFGFEFDSPDVDRKLTNIFPALELYCAVNRLSRSSSSSSMASSNSDQSIGISDSIIDPEAGPEAVKERLRQWAQVVGCSVRQFSPMS